MATITSAGSGDSNSTTANAPWPSGTVPVVGDKVNIASGHTVTMVATHHWGDDTTTGVNVLSGGTLKASRALASQLTCRGTFVNAGTVDYGTEADPIPTGVTAVIIGNESAAMANAKYGITSSGTPTWRMWGKTRARLTTLTASAIISATSFDVADLTGWEVGDLVMFGPSSNSSQVLDYRAITVITPGAGTAGTVTVGAALSAASSVGRYVVNLTSNVKVTGATPQTYKQAPKNIISTGGTQVIEVGQTEFVGGGSGLTLGTLTIGVSDSAQLKKVDSITVHNIVSVSGSTVTKCPAQNAMVAMLAGFGATGTANRIVIAIEPNGGSNNGFGPQTVASNIAVTNAVVAGPTRMFGATTSPFGLADFTGPTVMGCAGLQGTSAGGSASGLIGRISSGTLVGMARLLDTSGAMGTQTYSACDFTSAAGVTTMNDAIMGASSTALTDCRFLDCILPSNFAIAREAAMANLPNETQYLVENINNDPLLQQRLTRGGRQTRDNSVYYRSPSSVRMDNWFSANAQNYIFTVPVAAGQTIVLKGAMRYNASYGTGTPASVTVSGLGITPVVATCPTTGADTWHAYSISVTNPKAYAAKFIVAYSGKSTFNAAGAYCYFDGVPDAPWVDSARHFGYLYDQATAYQIADARITLTEAAALALAVAVVHGATDTITVTAALTNAQVFEAVMADLAQTANLSEKLPDGSLHIESEDGADFETTYTVILSGAGAITGPYTDDAGRHVTVTAPNLLAGTRIQVYDVAGATELYNGAAALDLPITWTVDKTLRLRATKLGYLPLLALGSLTASGLSFIDSQEVDAVYVSNAIDGSTVGELDPDFPNVEMDIDDADGLTSWQRIYAWFQYNVTTEQGIAEFFGAFEAIDPLNYVARTAVVNLKFDNIGDIPVVISGGYGSRDDGSALTAVGSGNIEFNHGRAYQAPTAAAAIAAYVWDAELVNHGASGSFGEAVYEIQGGWTIADAVWDELLGFHTVAGSAGALLDVAAADTTAAVADRVLGRSLAGGADGGRTVRDALRPSRNKTGLNQVGDTLTVYEEDDTTPAWTAAVTTTPRDALASIDPS